MTETLQARLARFAPARIVLLWLALLVLVEALALLLYLRFAPVIPTAVRYYVYPFVWINLGLLAVVTTTPPAAPRRCRRIAMALAGGYFLVLAWAGGLLQAGSALTGQDPLVLFRVVLLDVPPGWGPMVMYDASLVQLFLVPYKVVGYLALAYLVYVTVLDAAGSALGGLVGLLSCVSCSWPVLAGLVSGVVGSTSGVATFVVTQSYDISTVVFVVTVALLYWRPTVGD